MLSKQLVTIFPFVEKYCF